MVLRRHLVVLIAILLPVAAFAANKYKVKKGDNLYDLSKKFGVSVKDLQQTNNLRDSRLDIGDELIIPDSNNSNNNERSKDVSGNAGNNNVYTVIKGDTLSGVAENYGVSTQDIIDANKLKNTKLQIGQRLLIPPQRSAPPAVSETDIIIEASSKAVSENLKPAGTEAVPSSRSLEYTVQKGDTLGHIAVKFNVTSREISTANALKNDILHIGQVLKIPSPTKDTETGRSEEKTTHAAGAAVNGDSGIYIVEKGDTPAGIAEKLGVGTNELIKLNSLDSRNLQIGQKITVPGYQAPGEDADKKSEKSELGRETEPERAADYYTVRKGDTPSGIAEKLGVGTDELIKLNSLDSRNLQIGQKISIPGSNPTQAQSGSLRADAGKEIEGGKSSNTGEPQSKTEAPGTLSAEYIVRAGDNLYDLSKKFGTTVEFIKKKNNLKSDNLSIGQKLVLSGQGTTGPAPGRAEKAERGDSASKYTESYTVRKGDTIGHLAIRFGVSQSELKSVNGLTSDDLKIGQVLMTPATEKKEIIVVRETPPEATSEIYIKKRYVVKAGDTLSGIAGSFGVSVDEIKKASALKNDMINTGDILLIPVPQGKVAASKYTVAAGDTLGTIGDKFGVSVRGLKDANGLTSDKITVGMKLDIPGVHSTESPVPVTNTVVATPSPRGKYVVKKGDTLGRIAKRHGVSVTELKRDNNIKGSIIRVGQVLRIPGHSTQEPEYIAVKNNNSINNSNGHNSYNGTEVKNGRFSKESIIQVAKKYLGAPYKFGGYDLTTGIDCSGYVKKIFSRFNVELPRTARDIYYRSGNKVDRSELDSGDLVFFQTYAKYPSHVGIYIGNEEFIHASSASKMVTIDSINKRYYSKRYIGAKRIQLSGLFYDEYSKDYRGFDN